jgi:hypothetical protein
MGGLGWAQRRWRGGSSGEGAHTRHNVKRTAARLERLIPTIADPQQRAYLRVKLADKRALLAKLNADYERWQAKRCAP